MYHYRLATALRDPIQNLDFWAGLFTVKSFQVYFLLKSLLGVICIKNLRVQQTGTISEFNCFD